LHPRVTIVTPSFNQARFLEQTLLSVLGQGYPDLEYIVIDGASTDGSVEILQRYAPYLAHWVSEPDSGQAEAINKGLRRATGEIVAWLNSDDTYLPGAVVEAVEALRCHPEWGMVYGDVLSVNEDGSPINVMRYEQWGLEDLASFHIIGQPAVFMRRAALEQAGLLDPSYHFLLDHHLWLRMARSAPVGYVPQVWAAGRFHAGAKNIAQAPSFGVEAHRIAAWLGQDPDFSALFKVQKRKILGGMHWLDGWYLSEGGLPGRSLAAFGRSFLFTPRRVLRDWQRLVYTFLMLFSRERAHRLYTWLRGRRQPSLQDLPRWKPASFAPFQKGGGHKPPQDG